MQYIPPTDNTEACVRDCVQELETALIGDDYTTSLREYRELLAEAQADTGPFGEMDAYEWQRRIGDWWRHHRMAIDILMMFAPAELARLRTQYPEFA